MTEHLAGKIGLSIAQKSVAGRKQANEDSIGIHLPTGSALTNKGVVAVVADGVSAAEAGKEASEIAVQGFISDYYSTPDSWQTKTSAHKVLTALNRWLFSRSQSYLKAEKGFVCTFSALILKSRTGHLFHVGDSRIYRLRENSLELLTRDHTADVGGGKRYLTRALGMDLNLDIDYRQVDLQTGDIFLLCTDGIYEFLTDRELAATISENTQRLTEGAERLLAGALANESTDNLSCQLIRVEELPSESADDACTRLTNLPFAPYLKPGLTIDGYQITGEIHSSNRSEVYSVSHLQTNTSYVMKVASQNFNDDPAYIERFVMEEWIGRRVNNPHIIKVIEPNGNRSCLYYLMEQFDGEPLDSWMAQNPNPGMERLYPIIEQITKGVTALHRLETLHQDLKPGNILIDKDNRIKIIDFGSCLVGGINEIATGLVRDLALGTLHYSAPEYRLNRKPGVQADFFSIGIICYRLLCGHYPYGEKYADAKELADFYRLKYTPVYKYNPLIPKWIDGALKRMVSIQPESRYPELSEFIQDLKHPNPKFSGAEFRPLAEKYPLGTWRFIAGVSLLLNVALLFFLLS